MPVRVLVTSNSREVARALAQLRQSDIPKAQAVAATKAAYDARDALRASMAGTFQLRSRGLPKAIVAVPAEKSDWPKIHAIVGIRDDATFPAGFLARHVTGEDKVPARSAKSILVPTSKVRRTAGGRIPKSAQPRELIDQKRAFTDARRFYRRGGRGGRGRSILFTRVKRARIAARWDFVGIAGERFRATFPVHWAQGLGAAVAKRAAQSSRGASITTPKGSL